MTRENDHRRPQLDPQVRLLLGEFVNGLTNARLFRLTTETDEAILRALDTFFRVRRVVLPKTQERSAIAWLRGEEIPD